VAARPPWKRNLFPALTLWTHLLSRQPRRVTILGTEDEAG
jgi:hypothetical protein